MSAVAVNSTLARGVTFYSSTVGKKVVMAVTGIILFGFLLAHMAGNLQFFLGPEVLNGYAEKSAPRAGASVGRAHRSAGRRDPAHCIVGQPGADQEQRAAGRIRPQDRASVQRTPPGRCTGAARSCSRSSSTTCCT